MTCVTCVTHARRVARRQGSRAAAFERSDHRAELQRGSVQLRAVVSRAHVPRMWGQIRWQNYDNAGSTVVMTISVTRPRLRWRSTHDAGSLYEYMPIWHVKL